MNLKSSPASTLLSRLSVDQLSGKASSLSKKLEDVKTALKTTHERVVELLQPFVEVSSDMTVSLVCM